MYPTEIYIKSSDLMTITILETVFAAMNLQATRKYKSLGVIFKAMKW